MSCVLQGEVHVRGGSVAKQFTTPWAGGLPGRSGGAYRVHTEQTPLFSQGALEAQPEDHQGGGVRARAGRGLAECRAGNDDGGEGEDGGA